MTQARDKANIPVLNFASKGIDDNATSTAITIDSSGDVGINNTAPNLNSFNKALTLSGTNNAGYELAKGSTLHGALALQGDNRLQLINFQNADITFNTGTSASERMRINSTGLGIGVSAPSRKLQVVQDSTSAGGIYLYSNAVHTGTDTNALLAVRSDSNNGSNNGDVVNIQGDGVGDLLVLNNNGTDRVTVQADGKIGIGTSSPTENLQVMDTASNKPQIRLETSDGGNKRLDLYVDGSIGTIASDQSSQSLAFRTSNSERMRLTNTGLGIGNTVPGDFNSQAKNLVIGGGSGDTGMTIYSGSSSGDTGNIFFADGTSGSDQVRGGITYNHGDNSMNFRTNDGANRIYISSAGKVSIGNTNASSFGSLATDLVIGTTSGEHGLTIVTGTGNSARMQFSDNTSSPFVGAIEYSHSSNALMFYTDGSQRMRIHSSGKVSIGTSTADGILKVTDSDNETYLVVQNAKSGGSGEAVLSLKNDVGNYQVKCFTDDSFRIRDNANATDRLMISSGGTVFVSNTSEPGTGANGAQISNSSYHIFCRNTSGASVFRTFGSSGEFRTLGSGNAQNTNNSYGAISDRVLKENEVDASSQWNDIKALQIKHYNFKSKPNEKQLGVIAQDLEASGMNGLVENNQDELYTEDDVLPEGKNIGDVKLKNYKSVKYSILYMKSVKALQEAMERIETLEARITTLENA